MQETIKKTYLLKDRPESQGRKLIILIDGTWNDENGEDNDGVVTNIVKLYRVLAGDSEKQITRYFRGVGNDDDFGFVEKTINGVTGGGEKNIREHAYATIAKEYCKGDEILIFGFSRGAAGARMLASDLSKKGIPEEIREKVFMPNFSTKYSGSGLGLAITKRAVEHAGGKLWFDTRIGIGTSFYIELPVLS